MGCCVSVEQSNVAIVESFGKFSDILAPGCHCLNPCADTVKGTLSLRTEYTFADVTGLTSDQADVFIRIGIMYRVMPENCHLAFYRLSSPSTQISSFVVSALRPLIRGKALDELFLEREEISATLRTELVANMRTFGYEVVDILIVDLSVRGRIREAMDRQLMNRYTRALDGIKARIQNIRRLAVSEANVEVERLQGTATAQARKILASAFSTGMTSGNSDAADAPTESDIMAMMLMMQYYDLITDIKKSRTFFMPVFNKPSSDL